MWESIQVSKWLALPTRGLVFQEPFILLAIGSSYRLFTTCSWLCVSCKRARGNYWYESPSPPSKIITLPDFKMIRTQACRGSGFCVGWMRGMLICKKSLSTKNSHQFPAILNMNCSNQLVALHYELLIQWTFNWCAIHWCCVYILSSIPTQSTLNHKVHKTKSCWYVYRLFDTEDK